MPLIIDIKEATAGIAELLERVIQGEEVIISRNGAPVARWAPVGPKAEGRVPGSAKGRLIMAPDFDAPLPEEILETFGY